MEQKTEALYLINGDRFLHLRENGAGVGFATYDCATGEPQEFGQISKQNLPPDGQNAIPAARNWYLFELSSDDRKAIQEVSLQHLDTIPQSGVRRRRIWDDPAIPRDDVRLINSHYDDLYRVPNHSVIQIDRSDGSSYTARVEHLDDYHFDLGEYGNVYHICQFGEIMERNGSTAYPEIQTQNEQGAWELSGKGYLAIQSCEDGWDYTIYHSDFSVMDGGQLDEPELTIQEVREEILEAHHMEKGRRVLKDYDLIMDKVADAEELGLSNRPSTLEKLAELDERFPDIIRACGKESALTERRLWAEREASAEGNMREWGVEVTTLSAAEKARFRAAVEPMYAAFEEQSRLIQRIREA